jgi:hypothetical protein
MTATALTSIALDDEEFSLASYQQHEQHIPAMDGYRAVKLNLRFAGSGSLDRTSLDDLELLEAGRLGEPVRLIVVGEFVGKGFRLGRKSDGEGELSYYCTVKVLSVEAGEAA